MKRDVVLVFITTLGSMFCWWILGINPGLRLPWWFPSVPMVAFLVPIFLVALATGLSTALSNGFWPVFPIGSLVGTLGGIFAGILTIEDRIAGGLIAFFIPIIAAITIAASFAAALIGRRISVTSPPVRRAIWVVLIGYSALGPVALLFRHSLVLQLVRRDNRIAKARFDALQSAVGGTTAAEKNFLQTCDGMALRPYYSGPRFSRSDWDHIGAKDGAQPKGTADEDGYDYFVACYENGVYTIAARPRPMRDGALSLCGDKTGKPKCAVKNNGYQWVCAPCAD